MPGEFSLCNNQRYTEAMLAILNATPLSSFVTRQGALVFVKHDESITAAMNKLAKSNILSAPVVNSEELVVGMFDTLDCACFVAASKGNMERVKTAVVQDVMDASGKNPVRTFPESASFGAILQLFKTGTGFASMILEY